MEEDLFVGSAKWSDEKQGFIVDINVTKLVPLLEKPHIMLAMKTFVGKQGEQSSLFLIIDKLPLDMQNDYRTHSVRINAKYRQGKS